MVAPVEVGVGGVEFLVSNGLLKEHEKRDRKAVGEVCLAALEAWAMGRGARTLGVVSRRRCSGAKDNS